MNEWQPIETAPNQQKIIVGYFNGMGKWRTVMARYYAKDTLDWSEDHPNYGEGCAPEGWYEESEVYETLLPTDCEPTYWMSLPEPPKEQA